MPTALWALGLDVPAGLDGRVLTAAFAEGAVAANPVRMGAASPADAAAAPGQGAMGADEEEELRKTLEGLGYL